MSSVHSVSVKEQPSPTAAPAAVAYTNDADYDRVHATSEPSVRERIISKARRAACKLTTHEGWFGDYDYAWLCTPALPGMRRAKRRLPPFYALDAELPLFLAATCGLQHALAMLAGLIAPPIIFATSLNLDSDMQSYMISSSLIGCGERDGHV